MIFLVAAPKLTQLTLIKNKLPYSHTHTQSNTHTVEHLESRTTGAGLPNQQQDVKPRNTFSWSSDSFFAQLPAMIDGSVLMVMIMMMTMMSIYIYIYIYRGIYPLSAYALV